MNERINMRCPSCGGSFIFIGKGGYLTCSYVDCPEPSIAKKVAQLKEENAALKRENEALKGEDDGTEKCMKCGSMVEQVWHADDDVWNNLSGYPDGDGLLCIRCFDRRAQEQGVYLYWACQPDLFPAAEKDALTGMLVECRKAISMYPLHFGEQLLNNIDALLTAEESG